ncbi:MAG: manganese efflux pump MntP family protein [Candidatus Ornithospirochaeta sp.]
MDLNLLFINSIFLGFGLALDAFSVSVADAMAEGGMKRGKKIEIALVFGIFQALMPLFGWVCVKWAADRFTLFQKAIPYIALALLVYLGGKMILEARKCEVGEECRIGKITFPVLITQGIATSIDALSVGFAIAEYTFLEALLSSTIIGVTTSIICVIGLEVGKKVGAKFSSRATLFGGCILIAIGLEIFVEGVFF